MEEEEEKEVWREVLIAVLEVKIVEGQAMDLFQMISHVFIV